MKNNDWWIAVISFISGFLVAMIVFSWWTDMKEGAVVFKETQTGSEAASTEKMRRVTVRNQPAGRAVMVEKVILEADGWIAIRELVNDAPTRILGAVLREKGTHENVVVELLRATEPEGQYLVSQYVDNGDAAFDSKVDALVTFSETETSNSTFTAQTPLNPTGK